MSNFWSDKTVLITGVNGFVGRNCLQMLSSYNPHKIISISRKKLI